MAKRALITGVTGQDGSYLAELLLAKGYDVWGVVRRSSSENYERIEHLRDQLHFCQADLLDQPSLTQALLESVCEDIPGAVPVVLDSHDADSAPDAVVRWAEDNGVDAIVAVAHTRGIDRALKFMGSFSGHLVHHAPCPVVLLPHGVSYGGDA